MAFKFDFFNESSAQDEIREVRSSANLGFTVHSDILPHGTVDLAALASTGKLTDESYDRNDLADEIVVYTVNGGALSQKDSIAQRTDVLPKVYEGGLKIWECSFDAISCLRVLENPQRILDLGCGAGIVGLWCLQKWPHAQVMFHDLNRFVLNQSTIPNAQRNGVLERSSFSYGPWERSIELESSSFDVISTADTLYDPECHLHLHDLLLRVLTPTGKALIAAKRFYFGVGGGVASFRAVTAKLGKAQTRVIASFEDGSSNIRDVLEFTRLDIE